MDLLYLFSEYIGNRKRHGVDLGFIIPVGCFSCGRLAPANLARRGVAELIGHVPMDPLVGPSEAGADEVPVRVGNGRVEMLVGDRVFAEHVSGADAVAAIEKTGRAELVNEA